MLQQQYGMDSFGSFGRRSRNKPQKASTVASTEMMRRYDANGNEQFDQSEWPH